MLRARFACLAAALALVAALAARVIVYGTAGQIVDGTDAKVTADNGNIDAGFATPSFDGRNLEQDETSVATSPADRRIVAIASNDFRIADLMEPAPTTSNFLGLNVSLDGGATWFNTQIPGFPADTSPAGLASPLKGMMGTSDPVVRFDAAGDLYVAGLAYGPQPIPGVTPVPDNLIFVARYRYTPGSPAGQSTPHSAGNPPSFSYAVTTVVDYGAMSLLPDPAFFNTFFFVVGQLEDKPWMAIDTNPSSACFGTIYVTWTTVNGVGGVNLIVSSRSVDGGASFSQPVPIVQKGLDGNQLAQGASSAIAADGRLYIGYRTFVSNPSDIASGIDVTRSDDCGRTFAKPVSAALGFTSMRNLEQGLAFRTPTLPSLAVDDTDANTVYVAYQAKSGAPSNADIFVVRSTDGGRTWGNAAKVNDDATSKHQFFPTLAVSNGVLHAGWYDLRRSPSPQDPAATNDLLDVYYAASNLGATRFPAFTHNVKISDVAQQPNCRFGGRAFMGDYIELAAYFDGSAHNVYVGWADNRDIPVDKCVLDQSPRPPDFYTGRHNQNLYADRIRVTP